MSSLRSMLSWMGPWKVVAFASAACTSWQLQKRVGSFQVLTGDSMYPTFPVDRWNVLTMNRLSALRGDIRVGDIVTVRHVLFPKQFVTKRVMGLEGDVVCVPATREFGPARVVKVPKGHVWIQGDNLERSRDSRAYGPVPQALVVGKAQLQLWPRFGWVNSKPSAQ